MLLALESLAHGAEIGQFSGLQGLVQRIGKIGLTGVLMGQPQQSDNRAGGFPHGQRRAQRIPCAAVLRSGKERIPIDQIGQGAGLGAQAMNHMMVADDMALFAASPIRCPPTRQSLGQLVTKEHFQSVIVDAQVQFKTDQTRRNRVEHLAIDKTAAGRDANARGVIIAAAPVRQRLERGALQVHLYLPLLAAVHYGAQ